AKYKLKDIVGADHKYTYDKLCEFERIYKIDAVHIDQGEGTGIWTYANNDGRSHWELISFSNTPNDQPTFELSEYSNMRAQIYYEANKWLIAGGILDAEQPEWIDDIEKQLCWTKGSRHKKHGKKLCESKLEIKDRVGKSPDVADGFVL